MCEVLFLFKQSLKFSVFFEKFSTCKNNKTIGGKKGGDVIRNQTKPNQADLGMEGLEAALDSSDPNLWQEDQAVAQPQPQMPQSGWRWGWVGASHHTLKATATRSVGLSPGHLLPRGKKASLPRGLSHPSGHSGPAACFHLPPSSHSPTLS